jgi:glutamine amidotransferase
MCRWITLISAEIVSLSDIVLAPSNSLVKLSRDASFHPGADFTNNAHMNGDGFGVGWYHTNAALVATTDVVSHDGSVSLTPPSGDNAPNGHNGIDNTITKAAVFKDISPAWSNENLREICLATKSNCIMAHVRAASRNTGISHPNCHPFKAGRLLFCHNGRIDQFTSIRRRFLEQVSDEAFENIRGTTDSECIFALILTNLDNDGSMEGSPYAQTKSYGSKRLVAALKKTLHQIERFMEQVGMTQGYSTCNFSLTDGNTMVATRFCDKSPDIPPPSLYFAFGTAQHLYHELTNEKAELLLASDKASSEDSEKDETASIDSDDSGSNASTYDEKAIYLEGHESRPGKVMVDVDPTTASFIVASNPLTKTHTWHPMPRNSIMWCTRGMHPELRLLRHRKSIVP